MFRRAAKIAFGGHGAKHGETKILKHRVSEAGQARRAIPH
jgi:hypothetical protein